VNLKRFAIYIFDYGAPVGLRIAIKHPERITAIISQNGNAYEEGLSDGWNPIQAYWREPTKANRDALRTFLAPETTVWQYTHGVSDPSVVSPDSYSLDNFYLARPGAHEAQLDLFLDYASNVALYPQFQAYFHNRQPPLLAIWGRNDPFFLPAGAEASQLRMFASSIPATSRWKRITRKSRPPFATSSAERRLQQPDTARGRHSNYGTETNMMLPRSRDASSPTPALWPPISTGAMR
jgi:pimeloyl-ACP methyl ester carboxylesterase